MHTRIRLLLTSLTVTLLFVTAARAQHPPMPPGMSHEEHLRQLAKDEALKKRGADAMGFDQDATTHHFALTKDGGRIEVAIRDRADTTNLTAIRAHLASIATAFADGDFSAPLATHDEMPPGASTMKEMRGSIRYRYQELPSGGRVVITAADRKARAAIHDFLRYQIREHSTGDPQTTRK